MRTRLSKKWLIDGSRIHEGDVVIALASNGIAFPTGLSAAINLDQIKVLPVFAQIREQGNVDEADMLRTFNMGVGIVMVVNPIVVGRVLSHLRDKSCDSYIIGQIIKGNQTVQFSGQLAW